MNVSLLVVSSESKSMVTCWVKPPEETKTSSVSSADGHRQIEVRVKALFPGGFRYNCRLPQNMTIPAHVAAPPTLSVVIATRNLPLHLSLCLEALACQQAPHIGVDVIGVGDDGEQF